MKRDQELQVFVDGIAKKLSGRTLTDSQNRAVCVFCGKDIDRFKDAISEKEYDISGLCQKCQDEVFV